MLTRLLEQYSGMSTIYLSWDAASWHLSKMLHERIAAHNEAVRKADAVGPIVALAPLPAGAQFLNVIESVFSGMARAIIANSNYPSIEEARGAIDRYVYNRHAYIQERQTALDAWSRYVEGIIRPTAATRS